MDLRTQRIADIAWPVCPSCSVMLEPTQQRRAHECPLCGLVRIHSESAVRAQSCPLHRR